MSSMEQPVRASYVAAILAGTFTTYTGPKYEDPRIEAFTDRGPILELIVRCPNGTAIISYSKVERLYCGPRRGCSASKDTVIRQACG